MAEVVKIGSALPDQDVVDACEVLLARAKSGELRSLVWAGGLTGGMFHNGFQTDDAVEAAGLMYLALHALGHNRMLSALSED